MKDIFFSGERLGFGKETSDTEYSLRGKIHKEKQAIKDKNDYFFKVNYYTLTKTLYMRRNSIHK